MTLCSRCGDNIITICRDVVIIDHNKYTCGEKDDAM